MNTYYRIDDKVMVTGKITGIHKDDNGRITYQVKFDTTPKEENDFYNPCDWFYADDLIPEPIINGK